MTEREREVNLLLLEDKHYILINDLSRLLISQMTNHTEKSFFCLRCLHSFTKKEVLDRQREYCGKHDFVKITMPEKGSTLEFKNHKHSMRVPTAVYADFECMTKPIQRRQPNLEDSYTEQYQKHEPSGFCFCIVYDGKKLEPVLYTKNSEDENAAESFCKRIWNYIEKVWSSEVKPMVMTDDDKIDFDNVTQCWICQKILLRKKKKFVITVILLGNTKVLLIKNVTHFSGNQNLCL